MQLHYSVKEPDVHQDFDRDIKPPRFEKDGWCYHDKPGEGDSRKIVTLEQDGRTWVGIRAWNAAINKWMNGGEPEHAHVKAWRDLDQPARGFWDHGKFYLYEQPGT